MNGQHARTNPDLFLSESGSLVIHWKAAFRQHEVESFVIARQDKKVVTRTVSEDTGQQAGQSDRDAG